MSSNPVPTDSSEPAAAPVPKRGLGKTIWVLNTIEMWERLAYYNLRVMAPIYIMQADNPGGLHLSAVDKGVIYLWWSIFQSILPIVTGGLADRFGYKRTMTFSIVTIMIGYLMIGFGRDLSFISNYWAFFISIMVFATGTAFFKPSIQGSIAHNLTKENASMGWGIFYWVVNVGAFIGHYLPSILLGLSAFLPGVLHAEPNSQQAWRNLFLMSAGFTSFNLLLLFAFKDTPTGASQSDHLGKVLWRTVTNIFEPRLLSWILIMSGFWLMMYQLWDLQPNFIADWVDSRGLAESLRWLPERWFLALTEEQPRGRMIPQQVLLSANSLMIIIGVIGMAWITRRMRTLSAMLIGILMATVGILVAGLTASVYVLLLGIVFFSLGEMMTGPKKNEYLSAIAPPGKKGLYLGYLNIPAGIGSGVGGYMAGHLYKNFGEKANLALRYLAEKTPFGEGKNWNGEITTLEATLGIKRTEAMAKLQEITGLDPVAATKLLWDTYDPQYYIWIPFALVGVLSAIALWIFNRMAQRWNDMNA